MTLLGGAVYAGFFALAALWLAATNPDTVEEQAQLNGERQGRSIEPVGASSCCAGQSSLQ